MTGYMFAMGRCWTCKNVFTFDPERVPSIGIDPEHGVPADMVPPAEVEAAMLRRVQEPICRNCLDRANELRAERGEEPIYVLPGAYGPLDPTTP